MGQGAQVIEGPLFLASLYEFMDGDSFSTGLLALCETSTISSFQCFYLLKLAILVV